MDHSKALTSCQQAEFDKLQAVVPVDEAISQSCIAFYNMYKALNGNIPLDRMPTAMKCAFFVAEKNEVVYDIKGHRTKGVGLSLNQFLKNSPLDVFVLVLKDFIKKVKIQDYEVLGQLETIYKKLSFIMTFHDRFKKATLKLEYPQSMAEYTNNVTSMMWLLFIMTRRQKQFNDDPIENTFLLASVLSFFVIYAWDYARPKQFSDYHSSDKKSISIDVQHKILSSFNIKKETSGTYGNIYTIFNKYFVELVGKRYIRMSDGKQDFLSHKYIDSNYKRLDHNYQTRLTYEDLDQRLLLKERMANLTPSRFTPLAKQGYISKLGKTGGNQQVGKQLACHRELQYDTFDKGDVTIPIGKTSENVRIPESILKSPQLMKPQAIFGTPITQGMRMYNYLNEKSKKFTNSKPPSHSSDSSMASLINSVLECTDKKNEKTKEVKSNLIFSLYKTVTEDYLVQFPEQKSNEQMMKGLLTICIELVFFVSNINMDFDDIEGIIGADKICEWKACDFIMKNDTSIPSSLKLHILDLEVNLVSYKIWKTDRVINYVRDLLSCASNVKPGDSLERCVKRVLHHMAFQTNQICLALKLDDSIAESIFDTLKLCLTKFPQMLKNRHLDQLLICSIFCNCRKEGIKLKFVDIKDKYQEVNPHNKSLHEVIICKVFMGEGTQEITIIGFYNQVFIQKVRPFLDRTANNRDNSTCQIFQSSLRYIIPNQMGLNKLPTSGKTMSAPYGEKLLYAINESPIIKFAATFKPKGAPILSKRHLDFNQLNLHVKTEPVVKGEGLEEVKGFFQKFNAASRVTPPLSKPLSDNTNHADTIKIPLHRGTYDRR